MNPTVSASDPSIRLAGSVLGPQCHVRVFLHSLDEEQRVLLLFMKEGFERGEKTLHVVDPDLREEHFNLIRASFPWSESEAAD
ncbi:MAG: hypothetical protein ACREKS_19195 [Candidatus Rokuibacteriota bacterium]